MTEMHPLGLTVNDPEDNHSRADPLMPKVFSSLPIRVVWSAVSKAADKSRLMRAAAVSFFSIVLYRSSRTSRRAVSVLYLLLYAD